MKKIFLIFILLFPLASYAKWTKVTDATDGSSYYIDFESIKENNSYLYYWMLRDFLKPVGGYLSGKQLMEVDCKTPRKERGVSMSGYLMSMGEGVAGFTDNKLSEWTIKKIKDGEVGTSYKYQTHQVDLGATAKGKPKNTLIIKEGNITKAKGQRQKLAPTQQWVYDLIVKRLEGYPNGDEYNAVKENVKHMMGDQVQSNKKGNLFDTKVKEFQVKKLLDVAVTFPEKETIIQIKKS